MELESKDDGFCDDISLLSDPAESSASDSFPSLPSERINLDLDKSCDEDDEARPLGQIPKHNKKYNKTTNKNHPGVILLGRGNSFSLGRSEVIVLNRKHHWKSKSDNCSDDNRNTNEVNNNNKTVDDPLHVSAPPPVSNGRSEEFSLHQSDLDLLWSKAETVMFAKQEAVQRVLEDFGIGEAGGRGDEGEHSGLEEENVWQVVQENFQV